MIKQYAYKFQLRPTDQQAKTMSQFAGCNRLVWNKALALQKERLDKKQFVFKYTELADQLIQWKKELPFLAQTHSQTYQQTLKNLDRALKEAFNKKNPKQFPVFKKKGLKDSFKYPQGFKVNQERSEIYLPKIGWVKYRNSREIQGTVKNVIVAKNCNKWYVAVQVEIEVAKPQHQSTSIVGVDVGISKFATCSDGKIYQPVNSFRNHEKRLVFLQRGLSRKKKFSRNWKKQKEKIQKVHSKIVRIRHDYLHKTTNEISKNHAVVILEDLKISNMSKKAKENNVKAKSGLNKSILDQGWYEFRRQLEYKLKWRGGELFLVNPQYTSQKCSKCGHVHADNRTSQAEFECVKCGHSENADINASRNILVAGHAMFACGGCGISQPMKHEPDRTAKLKSFA